MWKLGLALSPLSTIKDHGFIVIMQTGLKKVSKCVLKHSRFHAMLNFLFSGGFLHDPRVLVWQVTLSTANQIVY